MINWLMRALVVALATSVMTPVAVAIEMAALALIEGGNAGAGLAMLVARLMTIIAGAFVAAFALVLAVLWPASLALRRTALEQPALYMAIGALAGVALAFAAGSGRSEVDSVIALWFATWGAIAGILFRTVFRRPARGAPAAPAAASG
jgi:hypothetical protein